MNILPYSLSTLFQQLGLDHSAMDIEQFIEAHAPRDSSVALYKANFWSPAQAAFLKDAVDNDAEWEGVVGQLDELLRE